MKIDIDKRKIKKELKIAFWIAFSIIAFKLIIGVSILNDKYQYMNRLDYDVTVNTDGSMTVSETWDIFISKTNTIFKNFDKSLKYGEITNVTVKDLKTGKDLTKINEEMYHVTDDCYYALDIAGNKFEIAWGTGMENKIGDKKYLITYTVRDVVTDYQDCQELYWQFLSTSNEISCKKVTGTIRFQNGMTDSSKLKVWGHGPLNGNIWIEDASTVKFEVDSLNKNRMLEIRTIGLEKFSLETKEFKVRHYNYLDTAIREETTWAQSANKKSDEYKNNIIIYIVIYVIILLNVIRKIIKYYKICKKQDDGLKLLNLEYYRDIPRENEATPGEASYLYYFQKSTFLSKMHQSDTVAATILDLALKKYISLECKQNLVYVKILKKDNGLKDDEKQIYLLLKKAGADKENFEIGELNEYAKKHYYNYSTYIDRLINYSRTSLYKLRLVDKYQQALFNKTQYAEGASVSLKYLCETIILFLIITYLPFFRRIANIAYGTGVIKFATIALILLIGYLALKVIQLKLQFKTSSRIAILTQSGSEESEKWIALGNYLSNYSSLNEKEVPSLAIWEKYLVYATAFGIADKVIEQMKATYPEVFVKEYWDDEKNMDIYPILNFATTNMRYYEGSRFSPINKIESNASSAYKISSSEIAKHSSSSGSGGGGGFSSGGGGRRRRWPEWEADKT